MKGTEIALFSPLQRKGLINPLFPLTLVFAVFFGWKYSVQVINA